MYIHKKHTDRFLNEDCCCKIAAPGLRRSQHFLLNHSLPLVPPKQSLNKHLRRCWRGLVHLAKKNWSRSEALSQKTGCGAGRGMAGKGPWGPGPGQTRFAEGCTFIPLTLVELLWFTSHCQVRTNLQIHTSAFLHSDVNAHPLSLKIVTSAFNLLCEFSSNFTPQLSLRWFQGLLKVVCKILTSLCHTKEKILSYFILQ